MSFVRFLILCISSFALSSCSSSSDSIDRNNPFSYDLHFSQLESSSQVAIICLHGFGGNYQIDSTVRPFFKDKATVVSFNFPDHDKKADTLNPLETTFGTIDELLPPLYVFKRVIVDQGFKKVCLYGFSAGGAALINCISVLNTSKYDQKLHSIGISKSDKKKMLTVIQQGDVILDTPLKSIDEIVSHQRVPKELELIIARYMNNSMDPMESIKNWKDLSLNVLVHFQVPDEVLSNRDDDVFIETLKKYNKGKTNVLVGSDSGHGLPHNSLWQYYLKTAHCLGFD